MMEKLTHRRNEIMLQRSMSKSKLAVRTYSKGPYKKTISVRDDESNDEDKKKARTSVFLSTAHAITTEGDKKESPKDKDKTQTSVKNMKGKRETTVSNVKEMKEKEEAKEKDISASNNVVSPLVS